MATLTGQVQSANRNGAYDDDVSTPPASPFGGDALSWRQPATSVLERVRSRFDAARVSLIRFNRGDESFEVVAATGTAADLPFLVPRARLPLAASAVASAASNGRVGRFSSTRTGQPMEHIAVLMGLRSGVAIPLTLATSALGASVVLWECTEPLAEDARQRARDLEPDLLQILVAPHTIERLVLVCHEDALTAGGLAQLIEASLGATARIAATPSAALSAVATSRPSLIVLSDQLSRTNRVGDLAHQLRTAGSGAPLLVLARTDCARALDNAVRAGATGYLSLTTAATRLPSTAAAMLTGRSALPDRSDTPPDIRLSEREHDVLLCLDRGLSDKQIAVALGVATSTVKTHARGIYSKLGASSRSAAVHRARANGLI